MVSFTPRLIRNAPTAPIQTPPTIIAAIAIVAMPKAAGIPATAVPATAAWNALVGAPQQTRAEPSEQTSRERRLVMCAGNAIMREAKLRGLGVAIAVEMFNEIIAENPDLECATLAVG